MVLCRTSFLKHTSKKPGTAEASIAPLKNECAVGVLYTSRHGTNDAVKGLKLNESGPGALIYICLLYRLVYQYSLMYENKLSVMKCQNCDKSPHGPLWCGLSLYASMMSMVRWEELLPLPPLAECIPGASDKTESTMIQMHHHTKGNTI